MARLLVILCLASVALAQDSIYSTEDVEPGQYVHNPEWDLTPYQLWERKQAAKKGLQANANSLPEPARKVVTVRKQKPKSRAQHQTYTQEYIFEANNNAQRIYS